MGLIFKKILVSIAGILLSAASCVIGIYLLFDTKMTFSRYLLFTLIFIGTPIAVCFMAYFMFRKRPPKAVKEEGHVDELPTSPDCSEEEGSLSVSAPASPASPTVPPVPVVLSQSIPAGGSSHPAQGGMNFDPETGKPLGGAVPSPAAPTAAAPSGLNFDPETGEPLRRGKAPEIDKHVDPEKADPLMAVEKADMDALLDEFDEDPDEVSFDGRGETSPDKALGMTEDAPKDKKKFGLFRR